MTAGTLILACLLDAVAGDPRWFPHPVRLMGKAIHWYEEASHRIAWGAIGEYAAGAVLAIGLPAVAAVGAWGALLLAGQVHPVLEAATSIALAWTMLAARDLTNHAFAVKDALEAGRLPDARTAVARIVGRDTAHLSEQEIVRGTAETIAESTSDGVIAPLLYLTIGGPPLAIAFKAISTLDSMVGHRTDRYRRFGWASARLDDVANWVPARLTAWLMVLATGLLAFSPRRMTHAFTILIRDGHRHPSPNSGQAEAAMAGALRVQLGGTNYYDGIPDVRPHLGDPLSPLETTMIARALRLMWTTAVLGMLLAVGWLLR